MKQQSLFLRFLVRVSYYEIYNEEVRDLLNTQSNVKLEVKERPDIGVFVKNLTTFVVNNADDMDRIMTVGNTNSEYCVSMIVNELLFKLALTE